MSIEALNWALRVPIGGNKKVVLLGMANHAGPDFCDIRPSVKTLATYAHCNERTVQRILRELEADGLIEKTGQHALKGRADRSVNVYRLIPTGRQNVIASDDGVTPATERGDTGVASGVTPTPPEPSVEPSVVSSSSLEAVVEPLERQEPSSTSVVLGTLCAQASNGATRPITTRYGGKVVSPEVVRCAEEALMYFGRVLGRGVSFRSAAGQPSPSLKQVIGGMLQRPEVTLPEWMAAIDAFAANPPGWVDGPLQLGHVFGEKAADHALAAGRGETGSRPKNGKAAFRDGMLAIARGEA